MDPLPVVLLEELVGRQVLVVCVGVVEVDVVEAEVLANLGHRRKGLIAGRLGDWRWRRLLLRLEI